MFEEQRADQSSLILDSLAFLEPSSVSRQHAIQLLDAALEAAIWKRTKDLIRLLKAIDHDECYEMKSSRISQILPPFSSPLSPPHAEDEDLSLDGPRNSLTVPYPGRVILADIGSRIMYIY